jgi:hypothetical protein
MLIDVSILANNGRVALAHVSWYDIKTKELHTDTEVRFDRRDGGGRHQLTYESLPEQYVDEVFGELMEAALVEREQRERLN